MIGSQDSAGWRLQYCAIYRIAETEKHYYRCRTAREFLLTIMIVRSRFRQHYLPRDRSSGWIYGRKPGRSAKKRPGRSGLTHSRCASLMVATASGQGNAAASEPRDHFTAKRLNPFFQRQYRPQGSLITSACASAAASCSVMAIAPTAIFPDNCRTAGLSTGSRHNSTVWPYRCPQPARNGQGRHLSTTGNRSCYLVWRG